MKKLLILLLVLAGFLSGCSTAKVYNNSYSYVFSRDLMIMDYVYTYRSTDHQHNANFVDGLQENDQYGNFIPALATEVTHNDDYTVWTYKIREGVNWVTSTGEVYTNVTAQDWVTGLQHAADFQSAMLYLVSGSIVNLGKYVNGETTDFSEVGVKALDEYTLEYTLNEPEPWFNTKTTYSILYPINQEFLESKGAGCTLGAPDSTACEFGLPQPDSILYNGAYILSSFVSKSEITYTANPNYWDKEHVYIPSVKLVYYDGSDPSSLLSGFENGDYSQARIYTSNFEDAKAKYPDNVFMSLTGAVTYNMTFNLARTATNFTAKTAEQIEDTKKAMLNTNFRLALQFAIDRVSYLATSKGNAELATASLRNMLTMPTFVKVDGSTYDQLVSAELASMNPEVFGDAFNLADGQDPFYNPATAAALLAKAKEELGTTVTWPIHLDLPEDGSNQVGVAGGQSMKTSIEGALGADNVVVDVGLWSTDEYDAIAYGASVGAESDFDISTASGWGPDYLDPKTYLDIYDPEDGDMLTTIGLNADVVGKTPEMVAAVTAVGLDEYKAFLRAAEAETTDMQARYALYAKADAWLVANAIQIPFQADGGNPSISKVVPFSGEYALTGVSSYKFKYLQVQDEMVTIDQRNDAYSAWTEVISK